MKVLITGANGFVGSYLSSLLASSFEVIATGKGDSRLFFDHPNVRYYQMDLTDPLTTAWRIRSQKPDVVVHAGAMSKPDDCELDKNAAWAVNVRSTEILLNESLAVGAFFIFLSTDFIFDGLHGSYQEHDQPAPVNYYGETKLAAEELIKNYPGRWSIVRTVLVYGKPHTGRQNLVTMVADSLRQKKSLRIFNDQVRTPTYVEDLVWAIREIITRGKTGIFHVSGKDVLSPYEMAVAVAEHLDLDAALIEKITAADMSQPAKRPMITGFDISKAKNELGYDPVSFKEGVRRTFQT